MMKYFVVGARPVSDVFQLFTPFGEVAFGAVPKVGLPSWSARGGFCRQVHLDQRGHGGADVEADVGAAVAGAQLRPVDALVVAAALALTAGDLVGSDRHVLADERLEGVDVDVGVVHEVALA